MITLYPFQLNASAKLKPKLEAGNSTLLIGATGTGKTYIVGDILSELFSKGYFAQSTKPFPVFYITKASVVPQTQEVLFSEYKLPAEKIFVTNYDQLRATLGNLFITWQEKYSRDLTDKWLEPLWRKEFMPELIVCDEVQACRNEETLQAKIMLEYVKQGGQVLAASATPFTRVSEARFCTLALKPYVSGFGHIKDYNWQHFAQVVSGSQHSPMDWNNAAVGRLTKQLENGIVRVEGVKFARRTFTHCKLIDFACEEDASFYASAYEEYLSELAAINKDEPGGVAAIWVAQTKFRIRSEVIRAPYLAKIAKDVVKTMDKQVIIASNYVRPLTLIKEKLLELGVKPERIAIIIGGQSKEERQENIKRFQTGQADYCLFTLKSGGVGLSLHHNPKNATVCKPRYVILPPTWSAIELVQALGRAHRINSISTTYQDIVWFRGTIEEEVAQKVAKKLHSMSSLVRTKETWTDIFSRKQDLNDVEELKQLAISESSDSEEDGVNEEFAVEAYDNPTDNKEEVKEITLELVKN